MGEQEKQSGLTGDNDRMHLNTSRSNYCVSNPRCILAAEKPSQLFSTYSSTRRTGVQYMLALCRRPDAADVCATFWLTEWIPNYTLE